MKPLFGFCAIVLDFGLSSAPALAADDGIPVDRVPYANRQTLSDFTAAACPDNPRSL